MFRIRTIFFAVLVLAFLPIDRPPEDGHGGYSAFSALAVAKTTFDDMAGFCHRNPGTCEAGRETVRYLGSRAQTGAVAVYEYFAGNQDDTTPRPVNDTLTEADLEPAWSDPSV